MPALDAALALAQNFHIAVLIGQHLKLDVPRRPDEFFDVNIGRTERRARFALRLRESPGSSSASFTTRMPRPPPPADAFKITG